MVSQEAARKPANRPSRRQDLIAAAVELFALQPSDLVTVADIVERAGMTPAAFYYHFQSREQLLEEVVAEFAETWIEVVERLLDDAVTEGDLSRVAVALLDEIEPQEQEARIFFLSGATAPVLVEEIRRDARARLITAAGKAVQKVAGKRKVSAATHVNGVAMVTLYETAIRARLTLDESYRTLGPRRFREELAQLDRLACGMSVD